MFVAAGQTAYMTSASGKAAVVAVFVLNGIYPTGVAGIDKDLPDTEKVLNVIQRASYAPRGCGADHPAGWARNLASSATGSATVTVSAE